MDIKGLNKAFKMQRNSAKYRGLEWDLTFDEWLNIWISSSNINNRGIGKGKYVMARIGDSGGYKIGNVEIIQFEKNSKDARINYPMSEHDRRSKQIGSGRGWTIFAGKFQVRVSKKYIGRFDNQEDAEAAYKFHSSKLLALSNKNLAPCNPTPLEDKS